MTQFNLSLAQGNLVKDIKDLHPRVPHVSRFEAVKKPSTKLIDRVKKQGKLGT